MASIAAAVRSTNAGDNRRAATLTVHYGRGDTAGVNAVMEETIAVDRVTALYLAVMNLHAMVIPKLHTVDGLACLTELVYTLAGDPDADPDCRRAARMIVAHSSGDVAGFNAVLDEVRRIASRIRTADRDVRRLQRFRAGAVRRGSACPFCSAACSIG